MSSSRAMWLVFRSSNTAWSLEVPRALIPKGIQGNITSYSALRDPLRGCKETRGTCLFPTTTTVEITDFLFFLSVCVDIRSIIL